ncbi:hypothetical protein [Lacinutrix cladophorae]
MKNLKNLGTALTKAEQKTINGGQLAPVESGSCTANILTITHYWNGMPFYGWGPNPAYPACTGTTA